MDPRLATRKIVVLILEKVEYPYLKGCLGYPALSCRQPYPAPGSHQI